MKLSQKSFEKFNHQLELWHRGISRLFPWQGVQDPYLIWVSEIFLQQTQADRVVEFFVRFTSRYPTVFDLAEATFEEALTYYRGLGYYGRLRRMIELARVVVDKYHGEFPRTEEELVRLPGIGQYTAKAILGFAFEAKVIAPDTNVKRVLFRVFGTFEGKVENLKENGYREKPRNSTQKTAKGFWQCDEWVKENLERMDEWYGGGHHPLTPSLPRLCSGHALKEKGKKERGGLEDAVSLLGKENRNSGVHLNQMLMDFGNLVCDAKKPKCEQCVMSKSCCFNQSGGLKMIRNQSAVRRKQRAIRHLKGYQRVVCGVVVKDKRILVVRRRADQTHPGLLGFPGGKVEKGEDLRFALQRELREELGIEVAVRPTFRRVVVDEYQRVLSFHRCTILNGEVQALEEQELIWLSPMEMNVHEFMPLDINIVEELKRRKFHLY